MLEQRPRLNFTLSYKGIIVGGLNDYHPEKVDFSISKSIDYIEGETEEQMKQRINETKMLEELLVADVEKTIGTKIKKLKSKINK
jgi:hypothetical protein